MDCVAVRGIEEMSFDVIGKMVKMERTHITYYFSNRKALIEGAIKYSVALGQEVIINKVGRAKNWEDRLKAVVEGNFEWFDHYPKHKSVTALFFYLCSYDREFRQLQNKIRIGGEERIAASFQSLVEMGKITEKEALKLSRIIQNQAAGILYYYVSTDYPLKLKQLKLRTVEFAVQLVKQAI